MPMTRPIPAFAALAAAMACASCAPVEEPEPIAGLSTERQCFFTRQINGYGDAPDGPRGDRIYIDTGPRDRWLLETFGSCYELDWAQTIALDTRSMSNMCTGDTATLIVPRGLDRTPDRCSVRLLGKMEDTR
jgi:hypothetical protein